MSSKFKKSDKVVVISGDDKGKIGEILDVIYKDVTKIGSRKVSVRSDKPVKVVVKGVNLTTIHRKPTQTSPGEIVSVEKPIDVSNVAHIYKNAPTRVGFSFNGKDKKVILKKELRTSNDKV